MIKKKLTSIGGTSWGVIIPKTILSLLNINPVLDEIGITIENDEIRIKKISKVK